MGNLQVNSYEYFDGINQWDIIVSHSESGPKYYVQDYDGYIFNFNDLSLDIGFACGFLSDNLESVKKSLWVYSNREKLNQMYKSS